ncbi:hypothetical protein D5086_029636 [Populus alba]|uniref:Uncharacterized protein n=1 Tax=Populus alba TaxID=43335 RepID=A0ACC4AUM6_POPAL
MRLRFCCSDDVVFCRWFIFQFLNNFFPDKLLSLTIEAGWVPQCPAFQRFAVRTSRRIDDISNTAAKKKKELAEQVKDLSKNFESFKNQQ